MSAVEITKPDSFVGSQPVRGGLADPALGANDLRVTCTTCRNTYGSTSKVNDCPGHFGHIEVRVAADHVHDGSRCVGSINAVNGL
jgi:DNA-directed RNA polymerase beta' subunit